MLYLAEPLSASCNKQAGDSVVTKALPISIHHMRSPSLNTFEVLAARTAVIALLVILPLMLRAMFTGAKPNILDLLFCATAITLLGRIIVALRANEELTLAMRVLRYLFPVFLIITLLRSSVFDNERIPTGSMLPTIARGQSAIATPLTYGIRFGEAWLARWGSPARGDIVIFVSPAEPQQRHIKRVVATAGDHLRFTADKQLFVNEVLVQRRSESVSERPWYEPALELHTRKHWNVCKRSATELSCVIPPDHFFVMGDNRDDSIDSRYHGAVPNRYVQSKVVWHGALLM